MKTFNFILSFVSIVVVSMMIAGGILGGLLNLLRILGID